MSFLQIIKGKLTGNDQERVSGVDNALNAMKDEKKVYLDEKEDALKPKRSTIKPRGKARVQKEGNTELYRDISAD